MCKGIKIRISYHQQHNRLFLNNQVTACLFHVLLLPATPRPEPFRGGLRGQHPFSHRRRVGRVRRPVLRRQVRAATGQEEQVHGLRGAGLQGAENADTEEAERWEEVGG